MGFFKPSLFLLLLLVIGFSCQRPRFAEARPLSSPPTQQRVPKIFGTLGLVCKCCDGPGGECTSTWVETCSKLQCLPWKLN
ncbi:Fibropellin-1 like [Actinidia chinensis var. chinensis]|uniref:Fibropellin-1 like n=1 Tax=Actinidia chinensis var. chinensis TaxID=1590841 RepID=A0A2R6RRJ6_ACTCC|nr:Fibropellin-1 like [Actinidia chinensis var. chinensis]